MKLAMLADGESPNVVNWCNSLTSVGIDVTLITFRPPLVACDRYFIVPTLRPRRLSYLFCVPYVKHIIKAIDPDILLGYYLTGYGTVAIQCNFHPTVLVVAGSDILLAPRNPVLKKIIRRNLRKSDLIVSWAKHLEQAALDVGGNDLPVFTLARGIPTESFQEVRCKEPVEADEIWMICTRSLKKFYNIHRVIEIVHHINMLGVSCNLTIVGEGPERNTLELQVRNLGLNRQVKLAGRVKNEDIPALLAQHNFYISLNRSEGVSASLLEAMCVGLMPIVMNNPSNRQWIESGINGILLDDLEVEWIAAKIVQLREDLKARQNAWVRNPEIVATYADQHRNGLAFKKRFMELLDSPTP